MLDFQTELQKYLIIVHTPTHKVAMLYRCGGFLEKIIYFRLGPHN